MPVLFSQYPYFFSQCQYFPLLDTVHMIQGSSSIFSQCQYFFTVPVLFFTVPVRFFTVPVLFSQCQYFFHSASTFFTVPVLFFTVPVLFFTVPVLFHSASTIHCWSQYTWFKVLLGLRCSADNRPPSAARKSSGDWTPKIMSFRNCQTHGGKLRWTFFEKFLFQWDNEEVFHVETLK